MPNPKEEGMEERESILIVDDDADTCRSLSLIFRKNGYAVETALKGKDAVEKARGRFCNLALLDIRLPDMEGTELLAALKQIHPDMGVIMVTAYASLNSAVQALDKGAAAYIQKPLNMDKVLATVRQVLEKQRLIMEKRRAETALQASEEKYRSLFAESKDAIVITTSSGKLIDVNQSALDLFGYTREEMMGLNFRDLYVDRVNGKRFQQEIEQKGFVKDFEVRLCKKGGRVIDSLFNVTLRRAADGSILGYQGIIRDVTEKRRNEERLLETMEKLRKAMGGVIQAMARTVEMRDPYTAGHQRRVADLARAISTEMGLSKDRVEGLRMAGAIHDLGKIAVPAEIFNKPGSLTEYEFGLIQSHAQVGHDILKDIDFPWPIAQIVLQHHERMNGSGYPQGLSGEGILMEARILSIADVVEAMSSHRPYRPAFSIEQALDEIKQNRGVLCDPQAVDACVRLFTEMEFNLSYEMKDR